MSSQIKVCFQHVDAEMDEVEVTFNIRHLRNWRKNKNGGMEVDPFGGYTILSEVSENGKMFVAKCNPKTDKFNRKEGLFQALKSYTRCNIHPKQDENAVLFSVHNIEPNYFVVVFGYYTPFQ